MGPFQQRAQVRCPVSNGTGLIFKEQTTPEVLEVHIPKGAPNGHKLKFSEKGNEIPDGDAGDVVIQLDVQPHERFKRKATPCTSSARSRSRTRGAALRSSSSTSTAASSGSSRARATSCGR